MKTSLNHQHIELLLRKGKRVIGDGITLIYTTKNIGYKKYAIIVPKKKVKKSVVRNKIKRIVREAVRATNIPFDMFIIMYTGKNYSLKEITTSIEKIIKDI